MSVARQRHLAGCAWFWAWAVVGAGAALTFVSTLGTLTAVPVALVAFFMGKSPQIRESAFGALSGAGLFLLYVGWIQRSGEFFDPRPWWAVGAAFLLAGIVAHAVRERR